MDFRLSSELEQFRQEVAAFIADDMPAGWDDHSLAFEEQLAIERDVMTRLAKRHWLALPWPAEYGGLGATPLQQLVFNEEIAYHRVPGSVNMGVAWVGPVVMLYGTDDQKERYLSRIADGSDLWCTLYSEPGSGSDLASMQTRAVRDGDEYVINGQKIWTSFGHYSDWGWLAARTDADVPKHKGLSTFAIDMKTPGIEIRPLYNMAGSHEFNEIFFDDVRIPATQLVGEENRGWYHVAVGLDFERSSIGAVSAARRDVDDLLAYVRTGRRGSTKLSSMPGVRHLLSDLEISANVGRLMAYNVAWMQNDGGVPTREANMAKLYMAELQQRIHGTALRIAGLPGTLGPGDPGAAMEGALQFKFLRAVANTIEGGTSEIQRNVIATRGLGLPRE
ncbi:MAG: acyl-CoA dehydrogenase family protein [Chloroflexi bacterium]|nr:acyl-CoA dehydrogenase family protein [Chloroflexota bacterium]